ncbi:MAG: hypothetical protein AAF384_12760 [Pseudomonadota bacterium]
MEWRYQRRRPFVFVCAAVYFALAFGDTVQAGLSTDGYQWVNGADTILTRALIFSVFGILAVAGIVGEAASRDHVRRTEEQVLASGAPVAALSLGRFLVSWLMFVATAAMFVPGVLLGTLVPGIAPEQLGPHDFNHYWKAMLFILAPNFLAIAAIVFAVGTRWRSQSAAVLAGVGLLVMWVLARMLLGQDVMRHDIFPLYSLLDPLAMTATAEFTIDWTVAQNNEQFVPMAGYLLWNRLLWGAIAVVLIAGAALARPIRLAEIGQTAMRQRAQRYSLIVAAGGELRQMLRWEFVLLARHGGVRLLLVLAALSLWFAASSSLTHSFSLPTTDLLTHSTGFYFDKVLILLLVWVAGDLITLEQRHRVHEMTDVLPTRDSSRFLAKTIVLLAVVAAFWLLSIAVNLTYQAAHGFYRFELGLHLIDSFVFKAPFYLWMAVLAISLQVLVRQRFIAMGLFLLIYAVPVLLDALGLFHPLYRFGEVNHFWYSNLDGYGHFWRGHLWLVLYWTLGSSVVWLLALGTYARGSEPLPRRTLLGLNLRGSRYRNRLFALALSFGAVGVVIYYQTAVLNPWPPLSVDAVKAQIEKRYGETWRGRAQPVVVAINGEVDLYPNERRFEIRGAFTLENQSGEPITEMLVMREPDLQNLVVTPGIAATRLSLDDELGVEHWHLGKALEPGARMTLQFSAENAPAAGFRAHARNDGILEVGRLEVIGNGTSLLNLQLMPAIGYTDRVEHKPRWKRRRYGLPLDWRAPSGEYALHQAHDTTHLGWVESIDMTITTAGDQIPLHAGRVLEDTLLEDGRRRVRFVHDRPNRGWSTLVSGRLSEHRVENDGYPPIVIYHDPTHTFTLDEMAVQFSAALKYFAKTYGPAPFETFRMAQQSLHYDGMGARSGFGFATEVLGWKSDLGASRGYVIAKMTAHLMGMAWFADQLIPANVAGAKIIHAGLPFWAAGLYLEQQQGHVAATDLRRQAMGEVFRHRGRLNDDEAPFVSEHKDSTMIRGKGMILMSYLAARFGHAALENAFGTFLEQWRYQGAPYPTAQDFIAHLRTQLPTEAAPQLADIFEHITRWDLRCLGATTEKQADGRWLTEVEFSVGKFHTSGSGKEVEVPFTTPVLVAVAEDRDFVRTFDSRWLDPDSGKATVRFTTDSPPAYAGLDPFLWLPDTNPQNHIINVRQR